MPRHLPTWVFDTAAPFYGWLTGQETWRAHSRELTRRLLERAPTPPTRILDLGAGTGVSALAALDVAPEICCVGLDFSLPMLRRAVELASREERRLTLVRSDAFALPFPDGCFDGLIFHSFLYLTHDRAAVAREAARVLAPGAPFAILEPREQGALIRAVLPHLSSFRFVLSMAFWRLFGRGCGRWLGPDLDACLAAAGLETESRVPTLGGLGWLVTGVRAEAS